MTSSNSLSPNSSPLAVVLLATFGLLIVAVGGGAWAGYRNGLAQRDERRLATQSAELRRQYALGEVDLAAGHYDLAEERFAYILRFDPDYPGAAERLRQAREARLAASSPTATASPTVSPTGQAAAVILARAREYYRAGDWDSVMTELSVLRALDAEYESVEVKSLLFSSLRYRGVERIRGKELEIGIFDLNQAETLGTLDPEAANYRAWARLYLAAQSYWGLEWSQTVQILRQLYVLAPNFHDTASKLRQATVNYAAELRAAGDYCGAAEQYAAAQVISFDQAVANVQAEAEAACVVTPTPLPATELLSSEDRSGQQ